MGKTIALKDETFKHKSSRERDCHFKIQKKRKWKTGREEEKVITGKEKKKKRNF
jgi:hypothetical protein